jgi:hypothetical protein
MRYRIGLAVAPRRKIGAHHHRVGALALEIGDIVIL